MGQRRKIETIAIGDDAKWAAVAARDGAFDGQFFVCVASTGIYCKPSCASRQPKRTNVSFLKSPAEAEAAGFRACKRCKPAVTASTVPHADKVMEACRMIRESETPPRLDDLAKISGLSPHHFHRLFKSIAGVTPKAFAVAERQKRVLANLETSATVTDAIYAAGFNSSSRFYATAAKSLGMTPGDFRQGGAKAVIKFAIGQCSLGAILVAESDIGVCAILLGDDPSLLIEDLQDRFPNAVLNGGDRKFDKKVATVVGFVEAPKHGLNLPLDIRGTVFQHKVWQALQRIPPGKTASYAEIAEMIGKPNAVRAVAGACAANPIAVAIPCHRVVRSDGALSGYRWGIDRKKKLLEREEKG